MSKRKTPDDDDIPTATIAGKAGDEVINPSKRPKPASADSTKEKPKKVVIPEQITSRDEHSALDNLAITLAGSPRQKHLRTMIKVSLDSCVVFSKRYYQYALRFMDAYESMVIAITEEDFVICVKYMLNCRLHDVAGKTTAHRYHGRTVAGSVYQLPSPIASMINDIGTFQSLGHGTLFVPIPPDVPSDPNQQIARLVTHTQLNKFTQFVGQLHDRGLCTLLPLSRDPAGTTYWLSHVTESGGQIATADSNRIMVNTILHETTPRDFMQSALVLLQTQDPVPGIADMFESSIIADPQAICRTYFQSA